MSTDSADTPVEYVPPRTDTEQRIARIWERTLKIEQVGVRDNFVDLGGDSLHAIRVMNDIRAGWSIQLTIEQLLEHQTIESQARVVDRMVVAIDRTPAGRAM